MKTLACIFLCLGCHLVGADPSLNPSPDPTGKKKFAERMRILADLDGDGSLDLLLSGTPDTFGEMGGAWTVYLRRGRDYVRSGEIWAHPKAISIEPDQGRALKDHVKRRHARIWVYLRGSGQAGSFGYYRIGECTVDALEKLEIYPGDGGTELGRAMYEATFAKSPIAYVMERSVTNEASGKVAWEKRGVFKLRCVGSPAIAGDAIVATCGSGGGMLWAEVSVLSGPAPRPSNQQPSNRAPGRDRPENSSRMASSLLPGAVQSQPNEMPSASRRRNTFTKSRG